MNKWVIADYMVLLIVSFSIYAIVEPISLGKWLGVAMLIVATNVVSGLRGKYE